MDKDDYTIDLSGLTFDASTDANTIDISGFDTSDVYSFSSISAISADTITITDSNDYDFTINRPGKPPLRVGETLERIMERLAILEPDFDKMDRYPALREAYNNYKTIEALLTGDDD